MNVDDQRNQTQDRDQLTDITNRLDALERKLDLILTKLDGSVIKNCDKMGNHIDFVNGVYATVKVPLNYISNKMHKIINPLGSPAITT
jgi:tetrahydromethanopterin S-methyltransferase subunit G